LKFVPHCGTLELTLENMKRLFVHLHAFSDELDQLIEKRKLLNEDFVNFERELMNNPKMGDVIPGLNGVRKVRLKSSCKGKRGGFRVDYLDIPEVEMLIFLVIYAKNEKEDLTQDEKKKISKKVLQIKDEAKKRG